MEFQIKKAIEILSQTPATLNSLLGNLSEEWVNSNEGENTWSPYDVVGHLIHGEETDWIPRAEIILQHGEDKPFEPFDRTAMFTESKGKFLPALLAEFAEARAKSIRSLKAMNLSTGDLKRKGAHPGLGIVTLAELLAAWTVHDLGHIAQIVRVIAKNYTAAVGPWTSYLSILNK